MNLVGINKEVVIELEINFDDFWGLYPRRVAKKEAKHAWNKIGAKNHPKIMAALYEWARIWKDRGEMQYVPHPATWLNGERWEDDFPPDHRPYTPQQARQERAEEKGERTQMPAHVIDAIRKLRG